MSDTPRTDAVASPGEYAEPYEIVDAEFARQLERENAELSDQLMRWFKAASPYATPGSLERALKNAAPQVTPEMSTSTADVTPADAAPLSRLQRRGIARLRAGIAWREFYNRCFGHVTEQERAPFIDIVTDAFTQPFCDE